MLRPRIPLLALLAALILPAAAHAGEPFTVGQGSSPHIVAVPGTDAVRAVWIDEVADKIHFCAFARGATGCALEKVLALPAGQSSPDDAYVLNDPANAAKVYIAMPIYASGKTFLYQSGNGGLNWNAGPQIYAAGGGTDSKEPIFNVGATELLFPSTNPDRTIFGARIDGVESATTTVANLNENGVGDLRDLQLSRLEGFGLVAVAHNGTSSVFFRLNSGSPSNPANWSPATTIGEGDDVRLAQAPGGNPAILSTVGPIGAKRVEVRRWEGSSFGAPTVVANEQGIMNDLAVPTDSTLGGIWRRNEPGTDRLRFGLSTDNGASWGVSTIAFDDSTMASMDLALAEDGKGFAIFEGSGDTGTGAKRMIKVASTDPVPEPVVPTTTGGGTTPTTTTPGTTTPPKSQPPAVAPPAATGPVPVGRRLTSGVPGATITVGLPQGCIPAGRPFVATLAFKKKKRKGNLFVKVTRTDFFIGSKRLKVDRKAPFRQTLVIPNPQRGQSYAFRARATIKVRRGKAPKKSIRSTLRVCG